MSAGTALELPELVFEGGIPGFREARRFALVQVGDGPFGVLRCIDQPGVEFVVVPPMFFFADYEPEIDDDSAADLGLTGPDDALLLVVVNVADDIARSTANLLGPIVINPETRRGAQVILAGTDHKTQTPLVPA
ncbi:MAG TPA: flagellar assembly protein FliW [Acidimicrobiales bacterium]|nr:flagellar assembly protein FliW [Acidimicrobiales bacterium]